MPLIPDVPFPKSAGSPIRSKDWNDLVVETQRLDTAKVNKSGDAITGTLSINGALGIGTGSPAAGLEINKGATNEVALQLSSSGAGWGSGVTFRNTASAGRTYGAYSGQDGLWHIVDVTANAERLNLNAGGTLRIVHRAHVGPIASHGAADTVGSLEVSGSSAQLSFIRRDLAAWPASPSAGDRFLWYNLNKVARLFTDVKGDLIAVDSDGRMGVGTTSPAYVLDVGGRMRVREQGDTQSAGIWFSDYGVTDRAFVGMMDRFNVGFWGNTGNTPGWRLYVNTTTGSLNVTGAAIKPGGGAWSAPSDLRLKKNVTALGGALERLLRLRGTCFEWKEPASQGNLEGQQLGFIAQEVEAVFPEWIGETSDGYKMLSIRGFEALTVEAFRDLSRECRALRERLAALEAVRAELGATGSQVRHEPIVTRAPGSAGGQERA